jgi:hypothetical protein
VAVIINLTGGFAPIVTGVGTCVADALAQTPAGAPCRQCLLLPTSQIPWDNCGPCGGRGCNGQLALAIREVYGSAAFPQPASGVSWTKCAPDYSVARVVVSVTRCVPTMDERGNPPSCAAELAAALTLENDRTAVRQALACCLGALWQVRPQVIGNWLIGPSVTVGESGGCAGVETEFLIALRQGCGCVSA